MTAFTSTVVAIDGPAGAGKSTVSRRLAERLGYVLLDTGALYRAIAIAVLRAGVDVGDADGVARVADEAAPRVKLVRGDDGLRVMLGDDDVTDAIREPPVSQAASLVSAHPSVRAALLDLQRRVAADTEGGVVAEGRDMGTVVFPDATIKFFLTAHLDVRARRRHDELQARGRDVDFDTTRAEVARRDRQDTERPVAPLRQAEDAIVFDSSDLGIDTIVERMHAAVVATLEER